MLKCIHIVWQFDISGKPFQMKGPKYNKHFWLRTLVFSSWKSFKEEFLVTVVLIDCCVNFVHILRTDFREEFKCACRKTLFESLVYWKPVNHVKMFCSKCSLCCPIVSRNIYTCVVKPAIYFYISYLNLDTMLHTSSWPNKCGWISALHKSLLKSFERNLFFLYKLKIYKNEGTKKFRDRNSASSWHKSWSEKLIYNFNFSTTERTLWKVHFWL